MLVHIVAILALTLFAWDVWRTIRRLDQARGASIVHVPAAHMVMAVVLMMVSLGLFGVSAVPRYVPPVGMLISARYFVAAWRVHKARKRRVVSRDRSPSRS